MKKEFVIFILMILLISTSGNVYAIGRGGGGYDSTARQDAEAASAMRIDCEDTATFATMRERIHCRIQNRAAYISPVNSVPEACRDLRTATLTPETAQGRCVAYYRVIAPCYNENSPQSKQGCLMRAAGIANSRLSDETENRGQKARDFMIGLFYDLEERLENKNDEGLIDDETTAEGIAKIVEIKRMILEGKTRAEIMPKMQELRIWWHENISPLQVVENANNNVEEDDSRGDGEAAQ